MPPIINEVLLAFAVTVSTIFAMRPLAFALGLVDRPGGRKAHGEEVPLIGGIGMFCGTFAALLLTDLPILAPNAFFVGACIIVMTGIIDDRVELSPNGRLATQACAALVVAIGADLTVHSLGNILFLGDLQLGWFAVPFTMLVIMTVINAFNWLDGMDGLAGAVAFACLLTLGMAAFLASSQSGLAIIAGLTAALFGFLIFNFPSPINRRLRTFMGDAGSMFLGFAIVWIGLRHSAGPDPLHNAVVSLYAAAVPIFDFFICLIRRLARGQHPMTGDRDHFHHILQRAGFSDRQVVAIMFSYTLLIGQLGLLASLLGVSDGVLFWALVALCLLQRALIGRAWRLQRWLSGSRSITPPASD